MEEPKLTNTVRKIIEDPAFKRMMRDVGVDKMIDNIALDKTAVTDAYIKAQSQINLETAQERNRAPGNNVREAVNAETMSNDEKRKMREDNPLEL